jgi:hypothetical protein
VKRIVATFNDLDEAQHAAIKLEQAGISAKVVDEAMLQRLVFLTKPLACNKVLVEDSEFDKARRILRAADLTDQILRHEIHCLHCGSPGVEYPHFTRNCLMPTFFGILLSALRVTQKKFYCRDCHFVWPATEKLRLRTDILNWPDGQRGIVKEERV